MDNDESWTEVISKHITFRESILVIQQVVRRSSKGTFVLSRYLIYGLTRKTIQTQQ